MLQESGCEMLESYRNFQAEAVHVALKSSIHQPTSRGHGVCIGKNMYACMNETINFDKVCIKDGVSRLDELIMSM